MSEASVFLVCDLFPPMNRRAIGERPFGTEVREREDLWMK